MENEGSLWELVFYELDNIVIDRKNAFKYIEAKIAEFFRKSTFL